MTARDAILTRIRHALGDDRPPVTVPRDHRRVGQRDDTARVARFADRVDDYRATVHRTSSSDLPATLADILGRAAATHIVIPADLDPTWLAALTDLDVHADAPPLDLPTLDTMDAVVTGAATAIADTGTIVLDGHIAQGRRAITLVPDHHICIVAAAQIVETVPEALQRLDPTRPLTLISGPSATSDIELDRVEGVHGPRTLDVILLEG